MQIRERVHEPRVNFGPCRPGAPRFVTKLRISFSEALVLREFLADRGRAARRPCGETVIWAASRADALGGGLMRLEDLVLLASYLAGNGNSLADDFFVIALSKTERQQIYFRGSGTGMLVDPGRTGVSLC